MAKKKETIAPVAPVPVVLTPAQEKRERIYQALKAGEGYREISTRERASLETIASVAALVAEEKGLKKRESRRHDWGSIAAYVAEGHTGAEARERFHFSGSAYAKAVDEGLIEPFPGLPPELFFLTDPQLTRPQIVSHLLQRNLRAAACEVCGAKSWRGQALEFELSHRNGDLHDNDPDNLQLLCPNCYSQSSEHTARRDALTARWRNGNGNGNGNGSGHFNGNGNGHHPTKATSKLVVGRT